MEHGMHFSTMRRKTKYQRRNRSTPQHILSTGGAPPGTFAVIDPFSKKLFIPMQFMLPTRALQREGVPSLCRLFLQGRCRQDSKCLQAHADIHVVEELRSVALSVPSCCERHGAWSDSTGISPSQRISITDDMGDVVLSLNLSQVTVTNGLRSLLQAQSISSEQGVAEVLVPMSSTCRLHMKWDGHQCCRFGAECNFVHVCQELTSLLAHPASYALPSVLQEAAAMSGPCEVRDAAATDMNFPLQYSTIGSDSPFSRSRASGSTDLSRRSDPTVFDPFALGTTAPSERNAGIALGASSMLARSFSSTASGKVWRHNPYASSCTSIAIET